MRINDFQPYIYFVASTILCYGYLLVLVNGYYHYNYLEFLEIGRKDLIARLGFLAYTTGFVYYSMVLIPVCVLTWLSNRQRILKARAIWIHSVSAVLIIGLLFYLNIIDRLIYGTKENWILGLALIGLSIPLYWNNRLLKKIKTANNKI